MNNILNVAHFINLCIVLTLKARFLKVYKLYKHNICEDGGKCHDKTTNMCEAFCKEQKFFYLSEILSIMYMYEFQIPNITLPALFKKHEAEMEFYMRLIEKKIMKTVTSIQKSSDLEKEIEPCRFAAFALLNSNFFST